MAKASVSDLQALVLFFLLCMQVRTPTKKCDGDNIIMLTVRPDLMYENDLDV